MSLYELMTGKKPDSSSNWQQPGQTPTDVGTAGASPPSWFSPSSNWAPSPSGASVDPSSGYAPNVAQRLYGPSTPPPGKPNPAPSPFVGAPGMPGSMQNIMGAAQNAATQNNNSGGKGGTLGSIGKIGSTVGMLGL